MKPTPPLSVRIRFSTKDVGRGFYRGTGTGSTGAHTPNGGFIIDYRKVRNYNVPSTDELSKCVLTPFVSRVINANQGARDQSKAYSWEEDHPELYNKTQQEEQEGKGDEVVARRGRAMDFLRRWRQQNPQQFNEYVEWQKEDMLLEIDRWREGGESDVIERVKRAYQAQRQMYE